MNNIGIAVCVLAFFGVWGFTCQGLLEQDHINACSRSCKEGGLSMQSYSNKDGCKCLIRETK